ncbi:hypothetical protein LTR54_007261 [Friedmanniomyces endolithicus]|nr:hypothetical protein LTR54_007261 [Friedmanniomyces endolithicus]
MDPPSPLIAGSHRVSAETSQDGNDMSTPATSPSSTAPTSPWPDLLTQKKLSADAADFSGDLSDYLPLGCLTFEDFTTLHSSDDGLWQDVTDLPIIMGSDSTLPSLVAKLAQAGWLRIQAGRSTIDARFVIFRMYILPSDTGLRLVDRRDTVALWKALRGLVSEVDVNEESWEGRYALGVDRKFDPWATCDDSSLFYKFNKLPSPAPSVDAVEEKYSREALEDLLDPASVLPGLKTVLYPYQRRSAGMMLQRESVAYLQLDPRLEQRKAPDGSIYYYGARDFVFLRQPRYYEAARGGILAESMGLGKTVILLSLILATKYHQPIMPAAYATPPVRPKVGRLSDIAISAINRRSIPWKIEFERERHGNGNDMTSCIAKLEQSPPIYEIPREPQRWNRKTILPAPKRLTLAATTLVVVPRNLCTQWKSEIKKHVEEGALKVLVMEDLKQALPPPEELCTYDLVLFSRNRFEREHRDGSDEQGRRMVSTQPCRCTYIGPTRTRDCHCLNSNDLYDSPLMHLHFKRLVIDEGHFFANSNSTAVAVANKLVTADHRWVVSGTPAKNLLGVEVDTSVDENMAHPSGAKDSRDVVLDHRRAFSAKDDTAGAVRSLGVLATSFLKIRPWCAAGTSERKEADWDEYIYRHEDARKRTYSGFSASLRRTLESMVVKTQPNDVERDIELPPFTHEVVRLEPSFYDKLSANLFTLVLTANAITSERTDADYLFHRDSAKARYQLVSNLRQSAFFWTGFSEGDVRASVENSRRYLEKEGTSCTAEDRRILVEMIASAQIILASRGWTCMSRSHELGLFVDGWPNESADYWNFSRTCTPLMTGVSQLQDAQNYVNERADAHDPGEGLAGAGVRALAAARHGTVEEERFVKSSRKKKAVKTVLMKSGVPTSSLEGEPTLKRRSSFGAKGGKSSSKKLLTQAFKVTKPQKSNASKRSLSSPANLVGAINSNFSTPAEASSNPGTSQPSKKRRRSELEAMDFSPDSPYLQGRIIGTASAKLSYLISRILKYYKDEKILVFYDGDNVAYYIAQMLELLHIKHEIYAKSLSAALKAEYVVRFDQEPQDRVLLMDVKQAAFGLNLSSASRIYFVNPVCRPDIEAQAIKRAHRIGQTRKVCVETLVLRGTIEEKMLERARRMTRSEHMDAKVLEDDGGVREIIQSARMLPVASEEQDGYGQMAALEEPQQLWGRDGWRETVVRSTVMTNAVVKDNKRRRTIMFEDITKADETARIVDDDEDAKPNAKRRVLKFVDCTRSGAEERDVEVDDGSDGDEPMVSRWMRASLSTQPTLPTGLRQDSAMPVFTGHEQIIPVPSGPPRVAAAEVSATASAQYRGMPVRDLLNGAVVDESVSRLDGKPLADLLQEIDLRREFPVQIRERREVGRDVLAHRGVRTASCFDRPDALGGEGVVAGQEFAVLAGEDVVGDGGYAVVVAESEAEGEHQGGFAGADRSMDSRRWRQLDSTGVPSASRAKDIPTNAYGERPFLPVAAFDDGHFAAEEGARTVEDFVGVAMVAAGVRVGVAAVVGVGVVGHGCLSVYQ